MSWEQGSFGEEELKKNLGLTAGDSSYTEGSSTGVKGNAILGKGYLGEDDVNRLLKNDQLKNAFVQSGGDADSWSTINDVDTAVDWLTQSESKSEPARTGPVAVSPELAEAKARVQQWEEDIMSGAYTSKLYDMDYTPGGENSFLNRYKSKMGTKTKDGLYVNDSFQKAMDESMTKGSLNSARTSNVADSAELAISGDDQRYQR